MKRVILAATAFLSIGISAQTIEGNILELHYLSKSSWLCSSPAWLLERDLYSVKAPGCFPILTEKAPVFVMDVDDSGKFALTCAALTTAIGTQPHCVFALTRDLRDAKGQRVSVPNLYAVATRRTFGDLRRAAPLLQRAIEAAAPR